MRNKGCTSLRNEIKDLYKIWRSELLGTNFSKSVLFLGMYVYVSFISFKPLSNFEQQMQYIKWRCELKLVNWTKTCQCVIHHTPSINPINVQPHNYCRRMN